MLIRRIASRVSFSHHDSYSRLVLGVGETQIGLHASKTGISDVGAIKNVEDEEET
jgi:hypothetical protein